MMWLSGGGDGVCSAGMHFVTHRDFVVLAIKMVMLDRIYYVSSVEMLGTRREFVIVTAENGVCLAGFVCFGRQGKKYSAKFCC